MLRKLILVILLGLVVAPSFATPPGIPGATTIMGSQPGAPGDASINVMSVQGVTSMTPIDVNVVSSSGSEAASQTNGSSSITVGGTFQTIAVLSGTRKGFEFQNVCNKSGNCTATTNNCYLFVAASGTPNTTGNSLVVPPGAVYTRVNGAIPTNAIQATCDGTADKFYLAVQ